MAEAFFIRLVLSSVQLDTAGLFFGIPRKAGLDLPPNPSEGAIFPLLTIELICFVLIPPGRMTSGELRSITPFSFALLGIAETILDVDGVVPAFIPPSTVSKFGSVN